MKMASFFAATVIVLRGIFSWGAGGSSLAELEDQLLQNNPQIRSLEAKAQAQKATVQSHLGSYLPELTVTGGYAENKTILEPSEGYLGYLSGRWNLFRGGENYYGKSMAALEYSIAQLDLDIKTRSLRRELQEIYFSRLAHRKNIALLSDKEEVLKNQRQMAQKKITAGLTSDVDGVEIELEENSILSEKETSKAEIARLNKELSALTRTDVPDAAPLATENFSAEPFPVNLDQGLESNPSVKRQNEYNEIASQRVSRQTSEFLPTIDLEGSYGRITPQYTDPLRGTESKIALLLSWNVFSGASSYYRSQATAFESKAQSFEKTAAQIDIRKDLQNLLITRDHLLNLKTIQEKRLTFSQRYYDMTLSEYKRGIKNSPDLQTATTSLFDTKRKLIELDRDLSITNAKIKELI